MAVKGTKTVNWEKQDVFPQFYWILLLVKVQWQFQYLIVMFFFVISSLVSMGIAIDE